MNYTLKLLIDNKWQAVELSDNFTFSFNYTLRDFDNPADIKTGYSNTLEIKGTPYNNALFNNIYKFGASYRTVNPNQKIEAQLSYNGILINNGYIVIDNITSNSSGLVYNCTFYDYTTKLLYDMKYNEDGSIKTLADLDWYKETPCTIEDIDNKYDYDLKYVKEAWSHYMPLDGPFASVNKQPQKYCLHTLLMPIFGYTGLYNNFDSNKVIVSHQNRHGEPIREPIREWHYMNSISPITQKYTTGKTPIYGEHFAVNEDGTEVDNPGAPDVYKDYQGWYSFELSRAVHPMEARIVMSNRLPLGLNLGMAFNTICDNFEITDTTGYGNTFMNNIYQIIQDNSELQKFSGYDDEIPAELYYPNYTTTGGQTLLELSKNNDDKIVLDKKIGATYPYTESTTHTFDVDKDSTIHISIDTAITIDPNYVPDIKSNTLKINSSSFTNNNLSRNTTILYYTVGTAHPPKTVPLADYYYNLATKIYIVTEYDGIDSSSRPIKTTIIPEVSKSSLFITLNKNHDDENIEFTQYIESFYFEKTILTALENIIDPDTEINWNKNYLFTGYDTINYAGESKNLPIEYYTNIDKSNNTSGKYTVNIQTLSLTFIIPKLNDAKNRPFEYFNNKFGELRNPLYSGRLWLSDGSAINIYDGNKTLLDQNYIKENSELIDEGYAWRLTKPIVLQGCYLTGGKYNKDNNNTVISVGFISADMKSSIKIVKYDGPEEFTKRSISKDTLKQVPVLDLFLNCCKLMNLKLDTTGNSELYKAEQYFKIGKPEDITNRIDNNINIYPSVIDKKNYLYKLSNSKSYADDLRQLKDKDYGTLNINTNINTSNDTYDILDKVQFKTLSNYNLSSVFMNSMYQPNATSDLFNITNKSIETTQLLYKTTETNSIDDIKKITTPGLLSFGSKVYINTLKKDEYDYLCLFTKDLKQSEFVNSLVVFDGYNKHSEFVTLTEDMPITFQLNEQYCYPLYVMRDYSSKSDFNPLVLTDANVGTKVPVTDVFFETYNLPRFTNFVRENDNKIMLGMSNLDNGYFNYGDNLNVTNLYNYRMKDFNSFTMKSDLKKVVVNVRFNTYSIEKIVRTIYYFENAYWIINKLNNFDIQKEYNEVEFIQIDYYAYKNLNK